VAQMRQLIERKLIELDREPRSVQVIAGEDSRLYLVDEAGVIKAIEAIAGTHSDHVPINSESSDHVPLIMNCQTMIVKRPLVMIALKHYAVHCARCASRTSNCNCPLAMMSWRGCVANVTSSTPTRPN